MAENNHSDVEAYFRIKIMKLLWESLNALIAQQDNGGQKQCYLSSNRKIYCQ